VSIETTNEAVCDLDDEHAAYQAGLKRVSALPASDYNEFFRRLSSHLRQRGFDYETINSAVARLWQERQTHSL